MKGWVDGSTYSPTFFFCYYYIHRVGGSFAALIKSSGVCKEVKKSRFQSHLILLYYYFVFSILGLIAMGMYVR